MKILFGSLIGIGITLALFFGYRKIINPNYKLIIPQFVTDTSRKRPTQEDIAALTTQSLTFDEKIGSLNKRIDDVLIFGGIIITLLLAINIGVYVNAQKEVDKHFKEHFEEHQEKVRKYLSEVEEAAGKIKAELELAETARKKIQAIQTPPHDGNN